MRVTNKLMADTITRNLFHNTESLLKTQKKLSSGKRISKGSEDPIGMSHVLDYRKTIAAIDQYDRNIDHGEKRLRITESALSHIGDLILRAEELAVGQATGTANEESRNAAAKEVRDIFEQIIQLGNTRVGNSYIFGGFETDTAPFSRDLDPLDAADDYDAVYNGDWGKIELIIGDELTMDINIVGGDVLMGQKTALENPPSGVHIFNLLRDLKQGLEGDDHDAIAAQLPLFSEAHNQVINARTEVGAKLNRLEVTRNHWADFKLNFQTMLSETEDVDLPRIMADSQSQQTAYQAALASASMIIQPSLINFLK